VPGRIEISGKPHFLLAHDTAPLRILFFGRFSIYGGRAAALIEIIILQGMAGWRAQRRYCRHA